MILFCLRDGKQVRFWKDILIETSPLKEVFNRLYQISEDKNVVITDMGEWQNEV